MYADLQRQYFAARRQYKQQMDWDGMKAIIRDIGYDFRLTASPDLQLILYLALDCGFFATLTDDRTELDKYYTTLLYFLQDHNFRYFLSGIYWWDCFRSQTIPMIIQCVIDNKIPLFHYCSECLDEGVCSHHYCKLWLMNKCHQCGVHAKSGSNTMESTMTPHGKDGLMLLAKVATDELEKCLRVSAKKQPSATIQRKKQRITERAKPHGKRNTLKPYLLQYHICEIHAVCHT